MGIKEILLSPFNYFAVPEIDIPISTIDIPGPIPCMIIISITFIFCSGGLVGCIVNKSPFLGFIRTSDGNIIQSCFDNMGLSYQFGAEGILAGATYTLGGLSILAVCYVLTHQGQKGIFYNILYYFGLSSIIWLWLAIMVFQKKIPGYFPSPGLFMLLM